MRFFQRRKYDRSFSGCDMWNCFYNGSKRALVVLFLFASLYAQQDTIMPVFGCIQYRVDFDSTDIDENCFFTDVLDLNAMNGSSFARGQCDEKGGRYIAGYATTYSKQCPDNGYYYTGCCTLDDCQTKADIADAYCTAAGLMSNSYCDNGYFIYGGCWSDIGVGTLSPVASGSSNTSANVRDQLNTNAIIDQLNANRETELGILNAITDFRSDQSMALDKMQETQETGFYGILQIGEMQTRALRNIENQTIKARYEQSGLLGNIELIGEEQLFYLDSINQQFKNGLTVDNSELISEIAGNHTQLMQAVGDGGETFEGVEDYDTTITVNDTNEYGKYIGTYDDSLVAGINGIDTIIPNYEQLGELVLNPWDRILDHNVCPFTGIEVQSFINPSETWDIELKVCEMSLPGGMLGVELLRILIRLLVYSGCAFTLYYTMLQAFSGTEVKGGKES